MEIKNHAVYQDYSRKNVDDYGSEIIRYGINWANMMEKEFNSMPDKTVDEKLKICAKRLSHEADVNGITGFMYGAAVQFLSDTWLFGEQLRQWHNLDIQYGTEGEEANRDGGVLNPALLNISKE